MGKMMKNNKAKNEEPGDECTNFHRPKEFGDFEQKEADLDLSKRVIDAILGMYKYYKPYAGKLPYILLELSQCTKLVPGEDNDPRLPYQSPKGPYSTKQRRTECVLSVCSELVRVMWAYQRGEDVTEYITLLCEYLEGLREVNVHHAQVFGDLVKGYYVWKDPIPQLTDLDGDKNSDLPDTPPTV